MATPYTLRSATANDSAFIWDMLYESLWVPEGGKPFSREILRNERLSGYAQGWGREGDHGVIAVRQDDRGRAHHIGAAWCRCFSPQAPGYGFISSDIPELALAVMPKFRGQGIGSAAGAGCSGGERQRRHTPVQSDVPERHQVQSGDPALSTARIPRRLGV